MNPSFDPLVACAQMCDAAQRQDWPELAALEGTFAAAMRHLLSTPVAAGREQELAALLREILKTYETLLALGGTVQQELANELQGLHRGRQARHAYKECT